jgi:hypothetical protein
MPSELETRYGIIGELDWVLWEGRDGPTAYANGRLYSGLPVSLVGKLDSRSEFQLEKVFPKGEYMAPASHTIEELESVLGSAGIAIDPLKSSTFGILLQVRANSLKEFARIHWLIEETFSSDGIEPNTLVLPSSVPNDPDYLSSWKLEKINIEPVWERFGFAPDRGLGRRPVIAIVDSGSPASPDLHFWTNEDEIPGNGLDDDQNGFIDDINGWNFVRRNGDLSESGSHGRQVTRVAGALTNNGLGTASPASHASIMLVNYFKDRQGSHFRALDAILYAVRNGADVVNCSYVTTSLLGMEAVFQEAYEAGVPIVAAAGPGKKDLADFPQFPAGLILPGVISVGASNSADTLGNSNFGKKHVDIFAPGVSTSLATPLVSSTVALLKALKPDATLEELVAAVIEGAEPVDALSDLCVSGGRLDVSGSARALLGDEIWQDLDPLEVSPPLASVREVGIDFAILDWESVNEYSEIDLAYRQDNEAWATIPLEVDMHAVRISDLQSGAAYEFRIRGRAGTTWSEWKVISTSLPGPEHTWSFISNNTQLIEDSGSAGMVLQLESSLPGLRLSQSGLEFTSGAPPFPIPASEAINGSVLDAYTISFWFLCGVDMQDATVILYEQGDYWRGLNLMLNRGFLNANAWNRPAWESDWAGTSLWSTGVLFTGWNHVALVLRAGESLKLYLNGQLGAEGLACRIHPHMGGAALGGINGSTVFLGRELRVSDAFQGWITQLSVWHRALSKDELESLLLITQPR